MRALDDLFTAEVGLMSLGGIVFMLGVGVFFGRNFLEPLQDDGERAAQSRVRR